MNPKFEIVAVWSYEPLFINYKEIQTSLSVTRQDVIRHINLKDGTGNWNSDTLKREERKIKKSKINFVQLER